jgi:hypothetical protein
MGVAENQAGQHGSAAESEWYFYGSAVWSKSDIWEYAEDPHPIDSTVIQ